MGEAVTTYMTERTWERLVEITYDMTYGTDERPREMRGEHTNMRGHKTMAHETRTRRDHYIDATVDQEIYDAVQNQCIASDHPRYAARVLADRVARSLGLKLETPRERDVKLLREAIDHLRGSVAYSALTRLDRGDY